MPDSPGPGSELSVCDAVQIALEMDARGVLDPEKRSRLEGHVAACGACSEFRHVVSTTDGALRDVLRRESGSTSAAESAAFVTAMRRRARYGALILPLLAAITFLGLLAGDWARNGEVRYAGILGVVTAVCLVPAVALYAFRRRTLANLLAGDDVVATHRRLLDDAVRMHRRARYVWLGVLLIQVALAFDPSAWQARLGQVASAAAVCFALAALVFGRRRVVAARRELARMR